MQINVNLCLIYTKIWNVRQDQKCYRIEVGHKIEIFRYIGMNEAIIENIQCNAHI